MQKIAAVTDYKVKFCFNKNAIVKTNSNDTLTGFYQQRKRWASKGLFYFDKFLILKLIAIYLFYLSLPIQLLLGIFLSTTFIFSLISAFFVKIFIEYLILRRGVDFFYTKKIFRIFLPAEIVQVFYVLIAGVAGVFGNFEWKNRKLKR